MVPESRSPSDGAAARSANPEIHKLAARVARFAVELDHVVAEIAALPLTEDDALVLIPPAAHVTLANAELDQLLYELEHRGRLGVPPIRLTAGELERAA